MSTVAERLKVLQGHLKHGQQASYFDVSILTNVSFARFLILQIHSPVPKKVSIYARQSQIDRRAENFLRTQW